MKTSSRHECEQDFELNIAPIIDCFVVLIAYLLISASFISLTSMDVQVAVPAIGADAANQKENVEISLDLDQNRNVTVRLTGDRTESMVVPAREGDWDFAALRGKLEGLRGRFPATDSAILTAVQELEYSQIVRMIEATRGLYPKLALGERDE